MGRYMRSPDGHGDAGTSAGSGDAGGDGGTGGEAPPEAPWYGSLSADAPDEKTPSDADWMKNKGFTDPGAMVKSYRSLEGRLGKGVEIPGEGATAEQIATFNKAIGVPETIEGYALNVPEGWEADMALFGPLREAALAGGMPAKAWDTAIGQAMGKIMNDYNALVDGQNAERTAWAKAAGGQADHNLALAQRGFAAFKLSPDDVQKMQTAWGEGGTTKALDLGLLLGQLSGEDGFIGGKRDFAVSAADAKASLAAFEKDGAKLQKMRDGDEATRAEWNRLIAQVSAAEEAEQRGQSAA